MWEVLLVLLFSGSIGALGACIIIYRLTICRDKKILQMCRRALEAQKKGHLMTLIEKEAKYKSDKDW